MGKIKELLREARRQIEPIIYSSFILSVSKGAIFLFGALGVILIGNLKGQLALGFYTLFYSFVQIFDLFSIPGIKTVIFKQVSNHKDGILKRGLRFSLKRGAIFSPLILILAGYQYLFGNSEIGILLAISIPMIILYSPIMQWRTYFLAKERFFTQAIFLSINAFGKFLFVGLFILNIIPNIMVLIGSQLLFYVVYNGGVTLYALSCAANDEVLENWKRDSYELTAVNITSILFNNVDKIIIGSYLGLSDLGIYSVIMTYVDVIYQILKSVVQALSPQIYRANKIKWIKYLFFLPAVILLAIFFGLIANLVITFVFEPEYLVAVEFIRIYLIVTPFYFYTLITNVFLISRNYNKGIVISKIVSIGSIIIAYLILIPAYGLLGGVIGSIVYFIMHVFFNTLFFKMSEIGII